MKFKTAISWIGYLYRILEKFNLEDNFEIDSFIDERYPELFSKLQSGYAEKKVAFCMSNGKKTSVNMFNHILETADKTVISNVFKSAKRYPIITSIILNLSKNFNSFSDEKKDFYSMGLSELELEGYFNSMKFDYLLLGNLLINQNEFLSLEEKRKKIQNAIMLNSKLNLIINADEPMFFEIDKIKDDTTFNKKRKKFFYGFNQIDFMNKGLFLSQKNDLMRCPKCGCKLDFNQRYYSHLGDFECACGFMRPKLDISANAKIFDDYIFLNVFYNDNKLPFKIPLGGLANAYNALGAIVLALLSDIDRKTIARAFETYRPLKSIDEVFEKDNKRIKIKTVKNPTSLSEALRELYGNKNSKIVFCLSDEVLDGVDTSWIWDANFGALKGFENKIFVCGNRFDDMALRLKYANVNPNLIVMDSNVKNALNCCFWELDDDEQMIVFSTPYLIKEVEEVLNK